MSTFVLVLTGIKDWPNAVVAEDLNVLDARQILRQVEEEVHKQDEAEAVPLEPLLGEKPIEAYYIDNLVG